MEKQRTISKEITLKGKGLHSGQEVELTFKPADPNTGYIFRRIDLDNKLEYLKFPYHHCKCSLHVFDLKVHRKS